MKEHTITTYVTPKRIPFLLGAFSGLAVFYFLYVFGAYGIQKGISYSGHSHLFRSISFGTFTAIYLATFESFLKPKLNIHGVRASILWYVLLIFFGSQGVFLLFNYFWNWQEWNFEAYILILKEFPLMMLLPLAFYLSLKTFLTSTKTDAQVSFCSENGKDKLNISLANFLFAQSADNYISIHYRGHQQTKTHLIRKPLKVLEEELLKYPEVIRSHRSYLVNRTNIKAVKQHKGKVLLEIDRQSLPVSKQLHEDFLR